VRPAPQAKAESQALLARATRAARAAWVGAEVCTHVLAVACTCIPVMHTPVQAHPRTGARHTAAGRPRVHTWRPGRWASERSSAGRPGSNTSASAEKLCTFSRCTPATGLGCRTAAMASSCSSSGPLGSQQVSSARLGSLASRHAMGSSHAGPARPPPCDRAQAKCSELVRAASSFNPQSSLLTRRRARLQRYPGMASAASRPGAPCSASSSPGPAAGRCAAAASGPLPAGSGALTVRARRAALRSSPIVSGAPSRSGGSLGLRERLALR
jgi:hypothetical protein